MNISALTDPNPKNYLDINCHNINCNILTANSIVNNSSSSSVFSVYSTGNRTISAGQSCTDLCDTFEIANTNFDIVTNVYTAQSAGDYEVNFSFSVANAGVPPQHVSIVYTAGFSPITFSADYTATIASQRNSYSMSRIVRLTVGQTIGYSITAQAGIGNLTINNILFSAKLLQ